MAHQRVARTRAAEPSGRGTAALGSAPAHRHPILRLQQTIGNGAVQRLVQRRPADPTTSNRTVQRQSDDDNQEGSVLGSLVDPALELAGDVIPGAGMVTGPLGAALGGSEAVTGESTFDKVKGALGFGTGTVGTAAEMGGFSLLGGGGEAAAGSMAVSALPEAAAAGELGTLGLAGPAAAVAGAGLAGVGLGEGMAQIADSSYTRTGAFGVDPDTGKNQSAMDWGSSWGTSVDKALGNTDPSILGGIAAGAGGIVGGIGGAGYGAYNWLKQKL